MSEERGCRDFDCKCRLILVLVWGGTLFWGAGKLIAQSPDTLAITQARLIDGTGAEPLEDAVLVIANGRFIAVGPAERMNIPDGARIIDVKGKTVVPGLIDAHFHMNYPNTRVKPFVLNEAICAFRATYWLNRQLMGGITTVMDAGAYHNVGVMAKKAYQDGFLLGSRPIVVGERINATGGHGVSRFDMAYETDGADEFRKAVRIQIKSGADIIKILPPYTQEELASAINEAHRQKKFVAVHSGYQGEDQYIRWAADMGADCIEHAYGLPDDVIEMMGTKGIYCVPTMTVMMKLHQGQNYVPLEEQRRDHPYEVIFKKLKRAGVRMAVGTDTIYEYMNQLPELYFEEVERFVKNGYTEMEAIEAATRIGAAVCDAADRLGTIERGKLADLLVLEADPLEDIRNLRRIEMIIQEGKIIKGFGQIDSINSCNMALPLSGEFYP